MAAKQIPLKTILAAMDRKDRDFYDNLDDDQKKGFSGFVMSRWLSAVSGSPDIQEYYLKSTNINANMNMFDLSQHKKLQWLMLTAASPGMGVHDHNWIKKKAKVKSKNADVKSRLSAMYPAMKDDDLEVMSQFVTKKDLRDYKKLLGEQ